MSEVIEKIEDLYIPETHRELLKILLEKVSKIFTDNKIEYFIDGGALLGMARNKELIPYDDDIDIGVFYKDFHKIIKLLENNLCDHFKIYIEKPTDALIKVYVPELWVRNTKTGKVIGTPTLDIFAWEVKKDIIRLSSVLDRQKYKNCYHNINDFYPLKKRFVSDLLVYTPNNPIPYLHRYYGDDCIHTLKIENRNVNDIASKNPIVEIKST